MDRHGAVRIFRRKRKEALTMKRINTRAQLVALAQELGVRPDWHEPDEQQVTATAHGVSFDNAGFWGEARSRYMSHEEQHVVLYKEGRAVATVNLATLVAETDLRKAPLGDDR